MACGVRGRLRARARPRRLRGRQFQQQLEQRKQRKRIRNGGGAPSTEASGEIAGAGSTAQEAAQKAWIAEFENANGGATISYDGVGSGGGREKFISGGVAYAGSDTPLSESEGELGKAIKRCEPGELVEVPDYISPIAIIYNLPGVEELKLEPETLAKIFNQEIENWNDPEIAKENPGVELPETRIVPVNRSDESGTTENFTDYLSKVAPSVWTHEVSGDWPVKGGEAASGTSGVVEAVAAGEGAIGYADASQAGELGKALIKVGSTWAEPSAEAAAKVLDLSKEDPELEQGQKNVIAFEIDRKTEASGVYPIILVSSLIGCTKYKSRVRSGPGQRLLRIRDQPRRAGAGRRTGRLRSALRRTDQKSRSRGRLRSNRSGRPID